ncbi:hypothetical protein, partial [Candidatus Clavichlamydia salmonicola]|uniref:hypothetical protein n=1 Tax=Candidatus Clavichlamydia salmonicola TaxID=469812 RepID=UPI001E4E2693
FNKVDNYFHIGSYKLSVIPQEWIKDNQPFMVKKYFISPSILLTIVKIISYFTIIIPFIFLIMKMVLRSRYNFIASDSILKEHQNISSSNLSHQNNSSSHISDVQIKNVVSNKKVRNLSLILEEGLSFYSTE